MITKQERVQDAADRLSVKLKAKYAVAIVFVDGKISVGAIIPEGSGDLLKKLLEKTLEML
jgi:hypothetical protein